MKARRRVGGHHHLDLPGINLAGCGVDRGDDAANESSLRPLSNVLSGGDQLDPGLLQLSAVALAFIIIAEKPREIEHEDRSIPLRLSTCLSNHALKGGTPVRHAGLARLNIGFDDVIALIDSGTGNTSLLLDE